METKTEAAYHADRLREMFPGLDAEIRATKHDDAHVVQIHFHSDDLFGRVTQTLLEHSYAFEVDAAFEVPPILTVTRCQEPPEERSPGRYGVYPYESSKPHPDTLEGYCDALLYRAVQAQWDNGHDIGYPDEAGPHIYAMVTWQGSLESETEAFVGEWQEAAERGEPLPPVVADLLATDNPWRECYRACAERAPYTREYLPHGLCVTLAEVANAVDDDALTALLKAL